MFTSKNRRASQINLLVQYLIFTFGISWVCWIPIALGIFPAPAFFVGAFGPTLSALFLTAFHEGKSGLQQVWQKLTLWRIHVGWYLFSLFVAVPVVLSGIWLDVWMGGQKPVFNDLSELYLVIPAFIYVLFTSVLGKRSAGGDSHCQEPWM